MNGSDDGFGGFGGAARMQGDFGRHGVSEPNKTNTEFLPTHDLLFGSEKGCRLRTTILPAGASRVVWA